MSGTTRKTSSSTNGDVRRQELDPATYEHTNKAVTSYVGMYILVAVMVAHAWLLGYCQCSFLWVFLTIGLLFVVWKSKISKTIAEHLQSEEAVLYRKRAFRQDETAEWFNFLLNRWWVFSSSNIEQLVKKRLDERLWDIRPSVVDSLELTTFSVGEQTPNVKNVRTFECSESTPGKLQPISWFNVHKPPAGLDKLASYQVVIESDLSLMSDDFKMIFRGRVGSSRVNVGFDLVVEDLNLSGTIQAIIHLSMDIPFPHISKATVCFIERPDVTFNIRMLKALSLMEIPLVKTWIHNNVMEGLTKAMVDPASVDLVVKNVGPTLMGQSRSKKEKAQGVLTVHIKGFPPRDPASEDVRYTVLSIGSMKRQTHEVPATDEWEDVCSFFIYNLATEKIRVKSKCMRLITSTTLEQQEVNLSSFPFQVNPICETTVENKDGSKVQLTMEYTPLHPVDLTELEQNKKPKPSGVAGVLYVCLHGASNVLAADKTGASDPYCVLFCDRKRILTTPFVPRTRNPHWESFVEFMVADYSRCSLSFFVYDWDGTNTINDDFLGSVHLNMSEAQPELIKKSMHLGYNRPDEGFTVDKSCGQITVSVVFRPVASVARSEKFQDVMRGFKPHEYLYKEDLMSPSSVPMRKNSLFEVQRKLALLHSNSSYSEYLEASSQRKSTATAAYVEGLLLDKVIVELTILQGKDMVAMDRNGYSDPFCVVSVQGKKIYTSSVKKKTLFPKWNETVTTELSPDENELSIDVYDKDFISNDYMGKLVLNIEQLKELSFKGTSDWYTLEKVKTGKLQIRCQVIAKDTLRMSESQDGGNNDVFEFPSLDQSMPSNGHPSLDITNSSIGSNADSFYGEKRESERLHPPPFKNSTQGSPGGADVFRPSPSLERGRQRDTPTTPPPRKSGSNLRHANSVNSVNVMQRGGDDHSIAKRGEAEVKTEAVPKVSASSASDRMFSVVGKVLRARGNFPLTATAVYCKVRLENRGNRLSLFSHSRIIGKSQVVSLSEATPTFNVNFEIDRGSGISMDAVVTFDLKHSSKEHLATKGFTLRSLLGDADTVCKWLPMGNGIELEVSLSQGAPGTQAHKRSGNIFKSSSLRREQNSQHSVV